MVRKRVFGLPGYGLFLHHDFRERVFTIQANFNYAESEEVIMVMIMPLEVKGSYRYPLNTNPLLPHPLQL